MNFSPLETPGGKLALTVALLVWLSVLAFLMHLTHHDPAETGRTLLSNAFTSLLTVLLTQLKPHE
jgi:hypothetical protein